MILAPSFTTSFPQSLGCFHPHSLGAKKALWCSQKGLVDFFVRGSEGKHTGFYKGINPSLSPRQQNHEGKEGNGLGNPNEGT